jgi:tellurite resistance protein TerC
MIVWIFLAAVILFLALDLGVFNKTPHIISSKEAKWTAIWALSFASLAIYWLYGTIILLIHLLKLAQHLLNSLQVI